METAPATTSAGRSQSDRHPHRGPFECQVVNGKYKVWTKKLGTSLARLRVLEAKRDYDNPEYTEKS
jgi:hypothetical protein